MFTIKSSVFYCCLEGPEKQQRWLVREVFPQEQQTRMATHSSSFKRKSVPFLTGAVDQEFRFGHVPDPTHHFMVATLILKKPQTTHKPSANFISDSYIAITNTNTFLAYFPFPVGVYEVLKLTSIVYTCVQGKGHSSALNYSEKFFFPNFDNPTWIFLPSCHLTSLLRTQFPNWPTKPNHFKALGESSWESSPPPSRSSRPPRWVVRAKTKHASDEDREGKRGKYLPGCFY